VRYKGQTGTVPLASLGGAPGAPAAPAAAAAPAKPAAAAQKPAPAAPKPVVADQPQSFYGNVVKKAEVNAAKHDDNLVKPANDVMDGTPSK
jgi:pilus assembly protein CpaC